MSTRDGMRWLVGSLAIMSGLAIGAGADAQQQGPSVFESPSAETASADFLQQAPLRSDARLHDVFFLDRATGWACGDRGTVWRTSDGGATWAPLPTGVSVSLRSIHFVDRFHGWTVGGRVHPYSWATSGVVLVTRDGGDTWFEPPQLTLPMLDKVRFIDDRLGWAAGCVSDSYSTGLFMTEDGGQTWRGIPAKGSPGWVAADLVSPHRGAMLGQDGSAWIMDGDRATPSDTPQFGLRSLADVALDNHGRGWLAGDGGLLLVTADTGRHWITTPHPLPAGASENFDFHAVATATPGTVWAAGSPGTKVFHSPDGGRTWTVGETGQSTPIRAMTFVDDATGWAVGDFGLILATRDGGRTWHAQRRGAGRAALLAVFAEAKDVPLEMLTYLSGNEGYISTVLVLGRRDLETPPREAVYPVERLHEAVVQCGAGGADQAWRFPLRQAGLKMNEQSVLQGWSLANDADGRATIQAELVRAIRTWRPEIIVTHAPDANGDPLRALIGRATMEAARAAAEPTAWPEQTTLAGLQPWGVKRMHAVVQGGASAELNLDTTEMAMRLGGSIGDVSTDPLGLITPDPTTRPTLIGFRTLQGETPNIVSRPDLLIGLGLEPGSEARRRLVIPPIGRLDDAKRMANQRRNLKAIFDQSSNGPDGAVAAVGQIGRLVEGLDDDGAARIQFELGRRYYEKGQWDLAASVFESLARSQPQHPFAAPAFEWLVQYYTSREAAWRMHYSNIGPVRPASTAPAPLALAGRAEKAAVWAKNMKTVALADFLRPEVEFPLAAANRSLGRAGDADRFYATRQHGTSSKAWRLCAEGELWLNQRQGKCPKSFAQCGWAPEKPLLDGKLDDAAWETAAKIALRSPVGGDATWPTEARLARDREFLYLAFRCGVPYEGMEEPGEEPRPRDPDLTSRDRVDILLDIDRDYATYYRFTADDRGWVAESCWGDSTWNPNWFVAAGREEKAWTLEIAIPLSELDDAGPSGGTCWAVGLQRTVPGVGFQAWNSPARQTIQPEGFGLLEFP